MKEKLYKNVDGVQTELSVAEYEEVSIKRAQLLAYNAKNLTLAEIETLESSITPRRIRDALISQDVTFLANVEAKIAILRAKL